MRLKYIKLSGFKSFVDTTKVSVTNNLIGIVGPNGCGKSNVIDAIRWVMGESSAKTLRGDSMDDVIFNGSAVRKPVNKAYVELVFDNSKGKAPGAYAKFAEIAIRRELMRDGGSKYFINREKCRRKDIHDIFLGTGLGPRSYSIIEQGMVGRIVESKPEDLRMLIEEAAGISKYKERRRETENRIRHTRDNLSRVDDIISELETQLRRLKRQANDAERYKVLKAEQRELESKAKTVRWMALHAKVETYDSKLERLKTDFEAKVAEQRGVESRIELMRSQQTQLTEVLNEVQARYYSLGGEVASVEQAIEHSIQTRKQQQEELDRLVHSEQEAARHLQLDRERFDSAKQILNESEPTHAERAEQYETAKKQFVAANEDYQSWQTAWENVNQQLANPEKERDVQRARIEEQDRRIQSIYQRTNQVGATLKMIDEKLNTQEVTSLRASVEDADRICQRLEQQLNDLDQQIATARAQGEEIRNEADTVRRSLQENSATLKALEVAAKEQDNNHAKQWLQSHVTPQASELREQLKIATGWEAAVDAVLQNRVQAFTVRDTQSLRSALTTKNGPRVWLATESESTQQSGNTRLTPLLSKITSGQRHVAQWLFGVYCVDSLDDADAALAALQPHESLVTLSGEWLGKNWTLTGASSAGAQGVLQRDALIQELTVKVATAEKELARIEAGRMEVQNGLTTAQAQRETLRTQFRKESTSRTELHNQLGRIEARSTELLSQKEQLTSEQATLAEQLHIAQDEVTEAQRLMQAAKQSAESFDQQRTELSAQRAPLVERLEAARKLEREAGDSYQAVRLDMERNRSLTESLKESIARLESQLASQQSRQEELKSLLSNDHDPAVELKQNLQGLLDQRLVVEKELSTARNQLAEFEQSMRSADQERVGFDRASQSVRDQLDQVKLERQEILVRRDTIAEELKHSVEEMLAVAATLDSEQSESDLESELTNVRSKLERIGAVNLVAIEEYEECSERKIYLDKQQQDLTEAMATLEAAMQKIDRETKTRFKDTFEALNSGFQSFFPQLFGGGKAYLELTSTDLLETGVAVMAQPPGKRNSTIHLLSGGEKALTAVSLLFAFFELNPAPFCVLDEVDAPLDDANVERYASILQRLSSKTQLLFITHNKITMEVADVLIGVTMAEAGVSRLIAVDVAEAAAMATQ